VAAEKPVVTKPEPGPEVKSVMPGSTAVPLPAPKPIELAAVVVPAAAAAVPMPEARPPSAPQIIKNASPEVKQEAKPRPAKYKRRINRRAPAQSSSPFRFFWQ
jgi:hypothetical protein